MNKQALAIASLVLLPLLWLWPSVFGGRTFVPFDVAQYPPASLSATPAQLAEARDGANLDVTEVPAWFVPETVLAGDELRAGRLPTWNPHARGGAPLHAHGLLGLCYPPNWLAWLAPEPAKRLVFVVWIDLALGGLLAFGLLRALGNALLPAWFGAVVFELCGPLATNAFFWMRLGSLVWLPGVLWAVHVTATAPRLRARHLAGLAVAVAMTWLAGFPPFAITTSAFGVAFAAWRVGTSAARWGPAAGRRAALRLCAGFALGGMLAAPQVLPSQQFFAASARQTDPSLPEIERSAFESYGLLGLLLPDAFSHPGAQAETPYAQQNVLALLLNTRKDAGKPALPNFNYTEYAVFVGHLALLLAFVGAVAGRGGGRWFALAALLVAAGMALCLPGASQLFRLPLVKNVVPMRWLAPSTLFVAWLAAIGLERLLASARALPLLLAGSAAGLAIACGVGATQPAAAYANDRTWPATALATKYGVSPETVVGHVMPPGGTPAGMDRFERALTRLADQGRLAAWSLAGVAVWCLLFAACRSDRARRRLAIAGGTLTALQLGVHGSSVTRGSWLARDATATPVHAFLRERAAALAPQGGFTIARGAAEAELPVQLPPGQLLVPGLRDLQFYTHYDGRSLQPIERMLGSHFGTLHASKGYLAIALPHTLPTPALDRICAADARVPRDYLPGHVFEHPLLDLLGVRYVLSVGDEALPHVGPAVPIAGAPPRFFVQERPTALPRAFAVATVVPAATDDEVVRALLQPDFAPHRTAFALASELPSPLPPAAPADAPSRTVAFTADLPTRVELAVGDGAQPWLVLTDTWLAGWSATIDGEPAPIVRGDHALRLVQLPTRACRVVFTYRAPGLIAGLALATFATLALALFAFAARRREA